MTAPSTAVPMVPPTCIAVDCRPPATPARETGALPTMTSVAPTMTGDSPRPRRANQAIVSFRDEARPIRDRPKHARAAISMPATIGQRAPTRVITRPETGAPIIIMAVIGSSRPPVATGSRPWTFSMKNVMKNIAPNIANIRHSTSTVPADSGTERNSLSGSSGSRARASQAMNSASAAAAATKKPMDVPLPQP